MAKNIKSLVNYGSHAGICLENGIEWVLSDLAFSLASCVVIGFHTTYLEKELSIVLENSDVEILVCSWN